METAIKIKNLKKSFGKIEAVRDLSLEIYKGEMFALVGPDGAGKTTTIRILCGLQNPDSGTAVLFDKNIRDNKKHIQNRIGYLSQKFSLYSDLTIDENIEFFADIHGVKDYEQRRNELLDFTRLTPFRTRLAENLSGGMKQKLALACSLIHRPEIIFLDEPTTGVDPVSRRDFWKILSDLMKEGITIIMTTPYIDEAERCSRVAFMHKGEIISLDSPSRIKDSLGEEVMEILTDNIRETYRILKEETEFEFQMFGDRINAIVNKVQSDCHEIQNILENNGIEIISCREISPSLENIFIHLIKNYKEASNEAY